MGTFYLISPIEDTSWRIELPELETLVRTLWPNACTGPPSQPSAANVWEWEVELDGELLEGHLHEGGQAVYLRGLPHPMAVFAAELKQSLVPNQTLFLYDSSGEQMICLENLTADDIRQQLL